MRVPIRMPKLGYDMSEGFVVAWLVGIGDQVRRGQPVALIETDKVEIEMESLANGVMAEIVHQADTDTEIPVGEIIGYLEDGN